MRISTSSTSTPTVTSRVMPLPPLPAPRRPARRRSTPSRKSSPAPRSTSDRRLFRRVQHNSKRAAQRGSLFRSSGPSLGGLRFTASNARHKLSSFSEFRRNGGIVNVASQSVLSSCGGAIELVGRHRDVEAGKGSGGARTGAYTLPSRSVRCAPLRHRRQPEASAHAAGPFARASRQPCRRQPRHVEPDRDRQERADDQPFVEGRERARCADSQPARHARVARHRRAAAGAREDPDLERRALLLTRAVPARRQPAR